MIDSITDHRSGPLANAVRSDGEHANGMQVLTPAETAEERARSRGWTTVRSLPPGAIITLEYLTGRINFEVEGGTVIRCWQG